MKNNEMKEERNNFMIISVLMLLLSLFFLFYLGNSLYHMKQMMWNQNLIEHIE